MKKLLGNKYDSFMESFETLNPVIREGNYLFSSGCLIHACTHLESAIAVNLTDNTIHTAIFRQDEKTRYFNEGGKGTPKPIRDWADNLRQLNTGTNSSESRRSFATTDLAVAQVEGSTPRRLRSSAPVRGFIGGESHDGYVVRARKGSVLTVRLTWRSEDDNRASLVVSESADFYSGEPAKFGFEYDDGRLWSGRVPMTGDYYVYVVAHPSAHYTLKVSAHASTAPSQARKFDEFGDVCCEDEKARLDNFANELQNNPDVQGYVVFYGGKRQQYPPCQSSRLALPRHGEAEARVARLKPYMNDTRGIDSNRVVVVNGGYRDRWAAELWIVPKGAEPPIPTPTVKPQEIRFRRGKIKKSDYECGV